MERYSASRLKTFDNCKLNYKLHYKDDIKTNYVHQDTKFGNCYHEIAQIWNGKDKEPLKDVVRKYNLDTIYKREIVQTVQNYFEFYEYYKIFGGKREEPIELKIEGKYWLYGIVDWLINPANGFLIIDHKTAKKVDRERHIFQMKMYGLIISRRYDIDPEYIKYLIYYPRLNYKDEFSITNEDILKVESQIIETINRIEACTTWPANKSFLCQWCNYYKSDYCL